MFRGRIEEDFKLQLFPLQCYHVHDAWCCVVKISYEHLYYHHDCSGLCKYFRSLLNISKNSIFNWVFKLNLQKNCRETSKQGSSPMTHLSMYFQIRKQIIVFTKINTRLFHFFFHLLKKTCSYTLNLLLWAQCFLGSASLCLWFFLIWVLHYAICLK